MALSEFKQIQQQLQQSRHQMAEIEQSLFVAREHGAQLAAEQNQLGRIFDQSNPDHIALQQQLAEQQKVNEIAVRELETAQAELLDALGSQLGIFTQLSDPRTEINQLDDIFPFLLFPLRLETRFKIIEQDDETLHQLWVRVFPDDCAIDTFEAVLSEVEIRNAKKYWLEMWRAGGLEADQRSAWRGLVSSHGAGRAMWLSDQYQPLNDQPIPDRPDENTIHLVIGTETPLPDPAQTAAEAFWQAIWLAGNDLEAARQAETELITAIGNDMAQQIIDNYRPFNLTDTPPDSASSADITLVILTVIFPAKEDVPSKRQSWSQAAHVNVLPDRLVLMGFADGKKVVDDQLGNLIPSPLIIGPNPTESEGEQIRQDGENIHVGSKMKWMVDFDEAVQKGMGFRVDLTEEQYSRGFDRLLVLGVRLSSDHLDSRQRLQNLIQHHLHSRKGFSILPQGSPTNNTETEGAAFSDSEDADDSFHLMGGETQQYAVTNEWFDKSDGQWLAEWLGIDYTVLQRVPHANQKDIQEAQMMNIALWPATLGYAMDTMLAPLFEEQAIQTTRQFYGHLVSGRGLVPAVRIGDQPYGILPATVFSRLSWQQHSRIAESISRDDFGWPVYLTKLHQILTRVQAVWQELQDDVSYVGKEGDPHQILLDILGLHATSVEYYTRYAETLVQLFNRLNINGFGIRFIALLQDIGFLNAGLEILRSHGYEGEERPSILDKFFFKKPDPITGHLIDDRPLSEVESIRAYTPDERNYIRWLADEAATSLETIRKQDGFTEGKEPTALLYLMLRHAILLGYYDAGVRLYQQADLFTPNDLRLARSEPSFVHVATEAQSMESRWQLLYQHEPRISGEQEEMLVAEFIPGVLAELKGITSLPEQIEALNKLADLPTARLERVFAEHFDTCSYRLDAWMQGLTNYQLGLARFTAGQEEDEGRTKGLFLGAFAWVENLKPENKLFEEVDLDKELADIFKPDEEPKLMRDSQNEGHIHAPSLNHAVTAAVLRNAYLSNATAEEPGVFSVNLSSERVRRAMGVLEGIRAEQSLSALLGYQFERGLHDRYKQAEVDEYIYKLRKVFPLRGDNIEDTRTGDDASIEAIEARNVIDGLKLVRHIQETGKDTYPFDKADKLPPAPPEKEDAINAEVTRLLDLYDAVADLAIAEGVHQVVQGNYERATATLDTYSEGKFPPVPDVVQTPRSGKSITHRVALHLQPGLDGTVSPYPVDIPAMTPRARAEPAINRWLADILPQPSSVACHVHVEDGLGNTSDLSVSQASLGLQPIDLLYLLAGEKDQAMSALDDRIIQFVHHSQNPRPDAAITIQYTERPAVGVSFFELNALIDSLRKVLLSSRPLNVNDLRLPIESSGESPTTIDYDPSRLVAIKEALTAQPDGPKETLHQLVNGLKIDLDVDTIPPSPNQTALVAQIDARLDRFLESISAINLYGLPQTGYGFAMAWKQNRYKALLQSVEKLVDRWQERLDSFNTLLSAYDALPSDTPDEERYQLLRQMELKISSSLTLPLPDTPALYRTQIGQKGSDFGDKLDDFKAILQSTTRELNLLLAQAISAATDIESFDLESINLESHLQEVILFSRDLLNRSEGLIVDLEKRLTLAEDSLTAYSAASTPAGKEKHFTKAATALLGEGFQVVPEFVLLPQQSDELANAFGDEATLLDFLVTTEKIAFPVDDWLHGIARVREKMHHWENITLLGGIIGRKEPALQPLQLPYQSNDHWLALTFPEDYQINHERLLYTAHFSTGFDKSGAQCGLLIDEWAEVIPEKDETTGIAFHYDQPNNEPPQVMLLVTPPTFNKQWEWQDLVDTLHETLEMAKLRAVEPDQIDTTGYARFLPATISAVTVHPITIALNLAKNNQVFQFMPTIGGEEDNG